MMLKDQWKFPTWIPGVISFPRGAADRQGRNGILFSVECNSHSGPGSHRPLPNIESFFSGNALLLKAINQPNDDRGLWADLGLSRRAETPAFLGGKRGKGEEEGQTTCD
jgi:hypothetical protein